MDAPFTTTRRIEFHQTDAAGIVHFSTFFLLMESAEHEFLRSLGLSVHMQDDEGKLSWPRISAVCDFKRALKFEEETQIEVRVLRRGGSSVTYGFRFLKDTRLMAEGKVTSVCCRMSPEGPLTAVPIPAWFAEKLPAPCGEA